MPEYKPYCYLIGWSKLNLWYYGSEYGSITKIANPSNLWTTYFTSSAYVADLRSIHGEPDVIQVRKVFKSKTDAILWEYKVLQRINIRNNTKWININSGKAPKGLPWSHEQKVRKSKNTSGDKNPNYGKRTPDHVKLKISNSLKDNKSVSGENNPMYGKSHTLEARTKMSKNHADMSGANNPNFGKSWTVEQKLMASKKKAKIHVFINAKTNEHIESTVYEMTIRYPELKPSGLKALCSARLKTYKSWSLCPK